VVHDVGIIYPVCLQALSHILDIIVGVAHKRSHPTAMPHIEIAATLLLGSDTLTLSLYPQHKNNPDSSHLSGQEQKYLNQATVTHKIENVKNHG